MPPLSSSPPQAMVPVPTNVPPTSQMDPFKTHLVALLSLYEVTPFARPPIPKYDGPADWQTDAILKSISKIAHRMWSAEEMLAVINQNVASRADLVFAFYRRAPSSQLIFSRRRIARPRTRLRSRLLQRRLLRRQKIPPLWRRSGQLLPLVARSHVFSTATRSYSYTRG